MAKDTHMGGSPASLIVNWLGGCVKDFSISRVERLICESDTSIFMLFQVLSHHVHNSMEQPWKTLQTHLSMNNTRQIIR